MVFFGFRSFHTFCELILEFFISNFEPNIFYRASTHISSAMYSHFLLLWLQAITHFALFDVSACVLFVVHVPFWMFWNHQQFFCSLSLNILLLNWIKNCMDLSVSTIYIYDIHIAILCPHTASQRKLSEWQKMYKMKNPKCRVVRVLCQWHFTVIGSHTEKIIFNLCLKREEKKSVEFKYKIEIEIFFCRKKKTLRNDFNSKGRNEWSSTKIEMFNLMGIFYIFLVWQWKYTYIWKLLDFVNLWAFFLLFFYVNHFLFSFLP